MRKRRRLPAEVICTRFDGEPTISVLAIDLGVPWASFGCADGCDVLGIEWDQGDHSMRHRGERRFGQVYPVTMEPNATGGTVLRWTIPPYDPDRD